MNLENVRDVLIFDGGEQEVEEWAANLYAASLAFHPDDDPADVLEPDGKHRFNADEAEYLRQVVAEFSGAEQEAMCDAILSAFAAQEHYFDSMDPPSPYEQVRAAAGYGAQVRNVPVHSDQDSFYEAARIALVNPDVRRFIAKHMDITDAEALRLRDELTRLMSK